MNKIELIGRVSNEPELRTTTSGMSVTTFNIAVNRKFKNSKGEYDTDFFTCKAFSKLAETINLYVKKGDKLGVSGSVYFSKYQAQDGTNRISTQVSVDEIDFLEPKKDTQKVEVEEIETEEVEDPYKDMGDEIELTDEDLPF